MTDAVIEAVKRALKMQIAKSKEQSTSPFSALVHIAAGEALSGLLRELRAGGVIPTPAETGGDVSHAAAADDGPGIAPNPSFSKAEGRTP